MKTYKMVSAKLEAAVSSAWQCRGQLTATTVYERLPTEMRAARSGRKRGLWVLNTASAPMPARG
jgi:hypothetical protein